MIKTLILDFDGTIADTRQSILSTIEYTLEILQIEKKKEENIQKWLGLTLKGIFTKITDLKEDQLEGAVQIYRDNYLKIAYDTIQLFPYVKETLNFLQTQEIFLAVASNKGKFALESLLNYFEIRPFIQIVMGEEDAVNKKPSPDMALSIIKKSGFSKEETLMVGDTIYDIRMGKNAGCKTCGVTYGNSSKEELLKENPDYIVNRFCEIQSLFVKDK